MMSVTGPDGMEAGWIDSPQGKLFACHHPARGSSRRDCAVLLCAPFGSDRMNLHASYRLLALRLSSAGFSVLRLDYPGTCDSAGHPRDPGLFEAWIASLHAGADWLKRASGAEQLCVFGALLGGTLATLLAAARDDVTGLVLWAALPSGRAFLHEAAAIAGLMAGNPGRRLPARWQQGDRETVGYLIPRAFAEALAGVDLFELEGEIARSVAVFRRGRAARDDTLAERFRVAGADVYVQRSPVVDIAALVDRHAVPPNALLDEMLQWWSATYPPVPQRPPPAVAHGSLETSTVLSGPRGARVREEFVRFGADRTIVGIVTEPLSCARTEPAIVLVNAGANHRCGINRNYTEWARSWAARGRVVLRMDLRGMGDSPPLRPEHLCELHRPESRIDIRSAFDFLHARHGTRGFVCVGLCAGAYQALHTALEDSRVTGLVMLNPLRFQSPRASFPEFRELDKRPIAARARAAFDPRKWLAALRGRRDLKKISRVVVRQLRGEASARAQQLASRLRGEQPPPSTWMAGVFCELTGRECNVLLVFNASEAIVSIVDEDLAAERERLVASKRFAIELIGDTDHIFSPIWSQERLSEILEGTLARWYGSGDDLPADRHAQQGT